MSPGPVSVPPVLMNTLNADSGPFAVSVPAPTESEASVDDPVPSVSDEFPEIWSDSDDCTRAAACTPLLTRTGSLRPSDPMSGMKALLFEVGTAPSDQLAGSLH